MAEPYRTHEPEATGMKAMPRFQFLLVVSGIYAIALLALLSGINSTKNLEVVPEGWVGYGWPIVWLVQGPPLGAGLGEQPVVSALGASSLEVLWTPFGANLGTIWACTLLVLLALERLRRWVDRGAGTA